MKRAKPRPHPLQRLWHLPRQRQRLLLETGWTLACMAWRVRRWRFARLAATLGTPVPAAAVVGGGSNDPQAPPGPGDLALAKDVQWAIAAWVRRLRPAPTCLMQAAAAQRLLARRGVASTLVFGVQSMAATAARSSTQGALGAHAWLRCGGLLVTGANEAALFRPIAAYQRVPAAGQP